MLTALTYLRASARILIKHGAALLGLASLSAYAAPLGTYYWGGGSGDIDYTTQNWSTNDSAPYDLSLSSPSLLAFYVIGGGDTLTFTFDYTGGFLIYDGYTFALSGYDLNAGASDFLVGGSATFDFANGASAITAGNTFDIVDLTIANYTVGDDSLRFISGLSETLLGHIHFLGYGDGSAKIDGDGYVTPVFAALPEPANFAALAGAFSLLAVAGRRRRR